MNYEHTNCCGTVDWVSFFFHSHDSLFPPKWKPNSLLVYSYGSSLNLVMIDSAGPLIFCSWLSIPGWIAVSKSFKRCVACLFYCGEFGFICCCIKLSFSLASNTIQICAGANVQQHLLSTYTDNIPFLMKSCQIVNNSITNGCISY